MLFTREQKQKENKIVQTIITVDKQKFKALLTPCIFTQK